MRIVRLLRFVSVRCRWFLCDENDRMLGHIPLCPEDMPKRGANGDSLSSNKVVAATHDTSYRNDAGGIKASSRWLSEATPPVMRWG